MHFTDLFIRRPVLATVISLMILVLGLRSIGSLSVRQFPFTQNAVVTVSTVYTGADPELMAGFITTPIENSVAQANGIDYLTSSSTLGQSTIQANLRLNYDPDKALTEINAQVNAVLNLLPKQAQQPALSIAIGETIDSMYIGFYSDELASNSITDYLIRVVQPKLQAIDGVKLAEILGKRQFALRAWLDPAKMAAFGLTSNDVAKALAANDFISAAGRTDGSMVIVNLIADTGLHSTEEFKNLILKSANGAIVRLKDVANVTLGAENYDTAVTFDGRQAVYIGIQVAPAANLLTVIDRIRTAFPEIQKELPNGLYGKIVYDATQFVNSSIHEVIRSLVEAMIIVTLVIFLFLGSPRSVLIPVIAIPLSLIGTFFIMLMLGYSINLLTLLALVLAIGLVVDDAIIVVENTHRHMEEGKSRLDAAMIGARELANPIIAISIVLIAVYVPIGFMGGLTGALFTEFAFTLAGAVGVSAVIALTLSPMMCSRFLVVSQSNNHKSFTGFLEHQFQRLDNGYKRILQRSLNFLPVTAVFAIIILCSNYFLYATSKHELAPQEDQGILISQLTTAPNASLQQTQLFSREVLDIFDQYPEKDHTFGLDGVTGLNSSIIGMVLKPWDKRKLTADQLQAKAQQQINQVTGSLTAVFQPPPLPGSRGLPIQFVIQSTDNYTRINEVIQSILEKARASGYYPYIDTDLKIDKLQTSVQLDREKSSELGLTMQDVGNILSASLSQNYINFFNLAGRSYQVIPQVIRSERVNYDQLLNYYITTADGSSVPLATIARVQSKVVPESINHFQQLNSSTISGVAAPGITMGQALDNLITIANQQLPQGYTIDTAGASRQYMQESSALVATFFFALIIIFLTLAALFESFRDPLIVLITVPMSICGAMIFISLGIGGATLNIYTEVGLVTLIGLISKHGILIVQFANDLQLEGKNKREAIEAAASIRLRPILMTTASMVLGVLPLITASGAGAVSRYSIGLVIATGISIGTLFTMFVVPAMYLLLADDLSEKAKLALEGGELGSPVTLT